MNIRQKSFVLLIINRFANLSQILILLIIFAVLACSRKAEYPAKVHTPELSAAISVQKSREGSEPSYATVNFKISDGWHIYGPKPQKNGRPTALEFEKSGAEFSDLIWPETKEFDEGLAGISIGYDKEFEVKAKILSTNSDLTKILAKISWVACKDTCVPGEAIIQN